MSCFRPLKARRFRKTREVVIGEGPKGQDVDLIELPCGKCIGCRLDRARAWSIRIGHEAQLYDSNLFLTLTYAEDALPSWSLRYEDYQGFMKRLRWHLQGVSPGPDGKFPIRFFCAGEYGERTLRPHFHAILFNAWFPDEVALINGTRRSALCERLWERGNVVIGSVNGKSAAYVAGYTLKKAYGAAARERYENLVDPRTGEVTARRPEFVVMSRRPGIGAWWYQKFGGDVLPGDFAVADGKPYKVPRYYWNKFQDEADAGVVEDVKERRYQRALLNKEDSTPERRAVREEVAEARVKLYERRL